MGLEVPKGWRLLKENEVIQPEDKWGFSTYPAWQSVGGLAGSEASKAKWGSHFMVIREAPEEKEWLNPWD